MDFHRHTQLTRTTSAFQLSVAPNRCSRTAQTWAFDPLAWCGWAWLRRCWVLWEGAWQSGGAARMAKWLALSANPSQFAVAQTMLWSVNGGLEILLGPLVGSLSDTFGRKWIIVFGRVGIGLIHLGYGFSTKLWHMVASECIGFGVLGAGNLATTNAAMDDMFGATPERAAKISARNLMYSSITGCIGQYTQTLAGPRNSYNELVWTICG